MFEIEIARFDLFCQKHLIEIKSFQTECLLAIPDLFPLHHRSCAWIWWKNCCVLTVDFDKLMSKRYFNFFIFKLSYVLFTMNGFQLNFSAGFPWTRPNAWMFMSFVQIWKKGRNTNMWNPIYKLIHSSRMLEFRWKCITEKHVRALTVGAAFYFGIPVFISLGLFCPIAIII